MKWDRIEKDLNDLLNRNSKINKPYILGNLNKEKDDVQKSIQESLNQFARK